MNFRHKAIAFAMLSVLAGGVTGCKDFLDVKPRNSLQTDQVYTDPSGAEAALIGLYSGFSSANYLALRYPLFADLAADNLGNVGTFASFAEIDQGAITPSNVETTGMWQTLYSSINDANNFLELVGNTPGLQESVKTNYIAQARALRAFHYFNLVRYWGDVPLVLTPTRSSGPELNVARNSMNEVYDQVQADLDAAEADLVESNGSPYVTKFAVVGLKARLALYRGRWQEAITQSDRVINSGRYQLVPVYRSIFDNENGPESIWEVSFTETISSQFAFFLFPSNRGGRGESTPNTNFATLVSGNPYEAGDTRKDASISNGQFMVNARPIPRGTAIKYDDAGNGTDNYIIMRLAEMILTNAEAKAQLNDFQGALDMMNQIRVRAGLAPKALTDFPAATRKNDILLAIEKERRLELAFEGHRWFDLNRTGRTQAVMGPPAPATALVPNLRDPRRNLFPIPFRETQNNPNMRQNDGY